MRFNYWIDRLGDWNPQLLRELKGRIKPHNLLVTVIVSLLGQFLVLILSASQVPVEKLWWLNLFVVLSFIGIFVLIVAGTYMLLNDVATEQRRDTLNFIRLSPKSTTSILVGKLLGVPILLYFFVLLAVPLHLLAGLGAEIPLGQILAFWLVVTVSCLLFYSAAILYSLVSQWLGGLQIWLGSGIVLAFLMLNASLMSESINNPFAWARLLLPYELIPNLDVSSFKPEGLKLEKLAWFYLPVGASTVSLFSIALLNCGIWTYWIWQGLRRCFRHPQATILSKQQSYLLTASFEVVTLGFAAPGFASEGGWSSDSLFGNLGCLSWWNFCLFLFLIAALSPHRQVLQDWARYRKQGSKSIWNRDLVHDLVWSEKSPALVAIGVNLAIATIPLAVWTVLLPVPADDQIRALFSLTCWVGLVLIYAALFQLMLLMKTQNQMFWASGTLGAAISLPPIVLLLFSSTPDNNPLPWLLFSALAPFALPSSAHISVTTAFLTILGQWTVMTILSLRLAQKLRRIGESSSKVLFAEPQERGKPHFFNL